MGPVPFPRETRKESSKRDEGWGQTGRLEEAVKKGVGVWSVGKHVHSGGRTHADTVGALK